MNSPQTVQERQTYHYTQLVTFENDDYVCKASSTVKEATELIDAGFEFVCEMDSQKLFRKRKRMVRIIAQSIWVYAMELGMGVEPI